MKTIQAISLFIVARLAEIGGAYLIWQWVRVGKPAFWGLLGLIALFI